MSPGAPRQPSGWGVLVAALLLFSGGTAAEVAEPPTLRIETGQHLATVRAIATDRGGRYAVTASEDKTARVWEVQTGRLLKVFRAPAGKGNDGKLFAVSMLADGSLFATGGWSAGNDVYLVDRTSAEVRHRIVGLPNVVTALAFAPDGRRLAVGLWGRHGLRLFESVDQWQTVRELAGDSDIGGEINALVWSADGGRLAASAADGALRLYRPSARGLEAPLRQPASGRELPFGLAFSPDGRQLAIGAANAAAVRLVDGETLKPIAAFSAVEGGHTGSMSAVAWIDGGKALLAAGTRRTEKGDFLLCLWRPGQDKCQADTALARDSLTQWASLPDGGAVFASAEPSWGVVGTAGKLLHRQAAGLNDFRNWRSEFLLAPDAMAVMARQTTATDDRHAMRAFDFRTLAWVAAGKDWEAPVARAKRTVVEGWFESAMPAINRRNLRLEDNELALTATVARDGNRIVIGSNFNLRGFNEIGGELWRTPTPASVWQVNVSADGRWLVAALADGTLRWYSLRDGREQLSFLAQPDGRRWLAWTPQGYFAASAGGEDLAGWQVERGRGRSADFFPVSRFRADYHRPELISEILVRGDLDLALQALGRAQLRAEAPRPGPTQLPPSVRILSPPDNQPGQDAAIKVRISVTAADDAPVRGLRLRINGSIAPLPEFSALRVVSGTFELPVTLPAVDADVMVFAENRHGVSAPAVVRVLAPAPAPASPARRDDGGLVVPPRLPPEGGTALLQPALYVLAVGVSDYADKSIRLEYSAKDATDLSNLLRSQEGRLYRKVSVKLLTDRNAKRDDILDGLEWIRREMTARDVSIVFFAGHGVNDADGVYYFLPHDTEVKRLKRTGVIFTEIRNTLVSLPGKALFFVDTCHSGNILGTGLRALPNDTTAIVNELASAENGVIVFTATTGRQYAQESGAWGNGAFTKALIEGLGGRADMTRSGRITHKMLDFYVSERVKALTEGAQSPVTITPQGVPDFPIAIAHQ